MAIGDVITGAALNPFVTFGGAPRTGPGSAEATHRIIRPSQVWGLVIESSGANQADLLFWVPNNSANERVVQLLLNQNGVLQLRALNDDMTTKSNLMQVDLTAADIIEWSGNALEMTERSDPAAPAANKARLYAKDNGAGKTELVVRFPTGAVQVIATEP